MKPTRLGALIPNSRSILRLRPASFRFRFWPVAALLLFVTRAAADTWLEGVDVSSYNGTIDWHAVAAYGHDFAFVRVSDGLLHLDANFASNYAAIKNAGMVRGAYQYFEPSQDPAAQANLLLTTIGAAGAGDLAPVLDVEVTGGKSPAMLAGEIQTWVNTIEQATGETPLIYTGKNFWSTSVVSSNFAADPLWIASLNTVPPSGTRLPAGWQSWEFWQYSASGNVTGIGGAVDLDRFNGDRDQLDALAHLSKSVPDSTNSLPLILVAFAGLIFLRRRIDQRLFR